MGAMPEMVVYTPEQVEAVISTALLPEQFFPGRTFEPEHDLALAMLEQAWVDLANTGPRRAVLRGDVHDWIRYTPDSWPFSFSNVCSVLGLDPAAVGRAMLER